MRIEFWTNVEKSKLDLKNKLKLIKKQNKKIHVYGASTKGNVILQYCGISNKDIKFASDRNKNKWGKFTPGSNIRIISEKNILPGEELTLNYIINKLDNPLWEFEYEISQ